MRRKKIKRDIILEVARDSFGKFGYRRTVIDDIVREAGVAKGTFYKYFGSKEELFQQVVKQLRADILEEFYTLIERQKSVTDKLRATLQFSFDVLNEHPIFAKLTYQDEEFRLALRLVGDEDTQKQIDAGMAFFRELFREGISSGELHSDIDLDATILAFGMLKFIHFFMHMEGFDRVDRDRFINALVDVAIYGVVKKKPDK